MKTIHVTAKCSDMFTAELREDGNTVGTYEGYVPRWFPHPNTEHYGDYVILEIDVDSGRILNWRKPTQAQLKEVFKKEEEA